MDRDGSFVGDGFECDVAFVVVIVTSVPPPADVFTLTVVWFFLGSNVDAAVKTRAASPGPALAGPAAPLVASLASVTVQLPESVTAVVIGRVRRTYNRILSVLNALSMSSPGR